MNGFEIVVVDPGDSLTDRDLCSVKSTIDSHLSGGEMLVTESRKMSERIKFRRLNSLSRTDWVLKCANELLNPKKLNRYDLFDAAKSEAVFAINIFDFNIRVIAADLLPFRMLIEIDSLDKVRRLLLVESVIHHDLLVDFRWPMIESQSFNGRLVVVTRGSPSFITDHLLYSNSSGSLVLPDDNPLIVGEAGATMNDRTRIFIGALMLLDLIGSKITSEILKIMANRLSDEAEHRASHCLNPMIENGFLEDITGRWFYECGL